MNQTEQVLIKGSICQGRFKCGIPVKTYLQVDFFQIFSYSKKRQKNIYDPVIHRSVFIQYLEYLDSR